MARQETLTGDTPAFDPSQHGIWDRFVDAGDVINHAAWLRACAEGGFVGTCRACGDFLLPQPPDERDGRHDYTAVCRSGNDGPGKGCGHEVNAPGGRRLRRSSRHLQMPTGWWDHRFKTKGA